MIQLKELARNPLLMGIFFSITFFFILYTARQPANTGIAEGYVQLIENISLPVLLSGDEQQLGLELQTLIQNTLIAQIRVLDKNGGLLLRVLNPDIDSTSATQTTTRRQILFENSLAGVLEVDLTSHTQANFSALILRSFLTTTLLFGTLIGGFLVVRKLPLFTHEKSSSQLSSALPTNASASGTNLNGTSDPSTDSSSRFNLPSGEHLLVVVRTRANTQQNTSPLSTEELENFNTVLAEVMQIYEAKFVAAAPNTQLYCIAGRANSQRVQQALMLAWGVTKLSEEQNSAQTKLLAAECIILHQKGSDSMRDNASFAFWTKLDDECPHTKSQSALLPESLHRYADEKSFQLEPFQENGSNSGNRFLRIADSASPIKRLWEKQRIASRP